MIIKIIASKPVDVGCSEINKQYVGKQFNTYKDSAGNLTVKINGYNDFIIFDGEYEIVTE